MSFSVFPPYSLIPLRYILYIYVFPYFPLFTGFSMDLLAFNHRKKKKKINYGAVAIS